MKRIVKGVGGGKDGWEKGRQKILFSILKNGEMADNDEK